MQTAFSLTVTTALSTVTMESTTKLFDCLIVGGPDHAQRVQLACAADAVLLPTLTTHDGQACSPVAFRRAADGSQLWLLLHPDASGEQLREQLLASETMQETWKGPERRRTGLHLVATDGGDDTVDAPASATSEAVPA